ncbi:hypothetical protein HDU67_006763 [Dinochytrium kinnereticum]|nr:hypothetical protein HDU67_006763 [Dinochytrium kinnereticum]
MAGHRALSHQGDTEEDVVASEGECFGAKPHLRGESALLAVFSGRAFNPSRTVAADGLGEVVPAWTVSRGLSVPGHVSIATEIPAYIQKTLDICTELGTLSRKEVLAVAALSGKIVVSSYPAALWSKRVGFDTAGLCLAEEERDSGLEFKRFKGWPKAYGRFTLAVLAFYPHREMEV